MANFKKYWRKLIDRLFYFLLTVAMLMLVLVSAMLISESTIMPMIAKNNAKDPNNIKTGGCLMYEGQMTGKNNASLYSLNGQDKKGMGEITIKKSPFERKWQSYHDFFDSKGLCNRIDPNQFKSHQEWDNYDGWFHKKFNRKYDNECFVVDYVPTKFWIFEMDFIYDVDKNFVCLE